MKLEVEFIEQFISDDPEVVVGPFYSVKWVNRSVGLGYTITEAFDDAELRLGDMHPGELDAFLAAKSDYIRDLKSRALRRVKSSRGSNVEDAA